MDINGYIEKHGISKAEKLFISAGSKPSFIPHIKRGARKPGLSLIGRLVSESKHEITFRDLLPPAIYEAIRSEILSSEVSTKSFNEKIEVTDTKAI